MRTRCKFVVESVQHWAHGSKLIARPVYVDDSRPENKAFWDATPGGILELDGVKNGSIGAFAPGQEFYVDLTPAADGWPEGYETAIEGKAYIDGKPEA